MEVDVEALWQPSTIVCKPQSAAKKVEQTIETTVKNNSNETLNENTKRKELKEELHAYMKDQLELRKHRMEAAVSGRDTTCYWRLITAAVEGAYVQLFKLQGKDAKAMKGRAIVRLQKVHKKPEAKRSSAINSDSRNTFDLAECYVTQARRLEHTCARLKKIADGNLGPAQKSCLIDQNNKTMTLINEGAAVHDIEAVEKINEASEKLQCHGTGAYPALKRIAMWHEKKADSIRVQAMQLANKELVKEVTDPKFGIRQLSAKLIGCPAQPLISLCGDKIGRLGQPIGSVTTWQSEIDAILRRAWDRIYIGNPEDLAKAAREFVIKYKDSIFRSKPMDIGDITGEERMAECLGCAHSAAGIDGWEPAEMAMLSLERYQHIAGLLNMVELGCPWPEGSQRARAAFMEKNPDYPDDPLEFRVLMICTPLYRRWAGCRRKALQPWIAKWAEGEMFAGVGSVGAEDAWMQASLEFAEMKILGTPFCGGAVDIDKCFDQLSRTILYVLAKAVGMPERILSTYIRFQEELLIQNTISGGLGKPYKRRCGIPQGDPLSMMMTALLLRPWVMLMKARHLFPSILADDILLVAKGKDMLGNFSIGLHETHEYLIMVGAKIAPKKSFNFASTLECRTWLENTTWPLAQGSILVQKGFRYLGAHLTTAVYHANGTIQQRFTKATAMARRLAAMPIPKVANTAIILAQILPMAFYGIETSSPSERAYTALTPAILACIGGKTTKRELDIMFSLNSATKADLDPVCQTLNRTILGLRRAAAKHPATRLKMERIIRLYDKQKQGATEQGSEGLYGEPAPHPTNSSRKPWLDENKPRGPIGLLLQYIHGVGGILDNQFGWDMPNEPMLPILEAPYQALAKLVMHRATTARTRAAAKRKNVWKELSEIDVKVTHAASSKTSSEDLAYLRTSQCGGGWNKTEIHEKTGGIKAEDVGCQYCGAEVQDIPHLVWKCPYVACTRAKCAPGLAGINMDLLPHCIKMGIAQAMSFAPACTFWGQKIELQTDLTNETLGISCTEPTCSNAKQLLQEHGNDSINDRQAIAHHRAGNSTNNIPMMPRHVYGRAPIELNVFSDGGLDQPANQQFSVGGFGIWWPNTGLSSEAITEDSHKYLHVQKWKEGIALWVPLIGLWFSTARTELAAAIMTACSPIPAHIGIDNQSVVDKANKLILIARKRYPEGTVCHVTPPNPLNKSWGTQKDGDLWEFVWMTINARGPWSIAVTKVKAHSTDAHVEQGKVKEEHRQGNNKADDAATCGKRSHAPGLNALANWMVERQGKYIELMSTIQLTIITILKEEKGIRKGEVKIQKLMCPRGMLDAKPFKEKLSYGNEDSGAKIIVRKPPSGSHKMYQHQQLLENIWTFIGKFNWEIAHCNMGSCISWIELLALFDLSGCNWKQTIEGKKHQLDDALQDGDKQTMRWKKHLAIKGSILKRKPADPCGITNASTELTLFKQAVRFLMKESGSELARTCFRESKEYHDRRLENIMTVGHEACIRMKPILTEDMAKQLTLAMLQCRPGFRPKQTLWAAKILDQTNAMPLMLKPVRLNLKRGAPWRHGHGWLPHFSGNDDPHPSNERSENDQPGPATTFDQSQHQLVVLVLRLLRLA